MPWFIHRFEVQLVYGGPEEGGWWFTAGDPTGFTFGPLHCDEDEAYDQCCALNDLEHERRKREEEYDFHSVLAHRSRHFEYDVDQEETPEAFPSEQPHYE